MENSETTLLETIQHELFNLNKKIDEKFDSIDRRFSSLYMNQIEAYKKIDDNFESMDKRLHSMDKRLSSLEVNVSRLSENSESSFSTVGRKIDELKYEVHKIQKVSNYSEEYENLMKIVQ